MSIDDISSPVSIYHVDIFGNDYGKYVLYYYSANERCFIASDINNPYVRNPKCWISYKDILDIISTFTIATLSSEIKVRLEFSNNKKSSKLNMKPISISIVNNSLVFLKGT